MRRLWGLIYAWYAVIIIAVAEKDRLNHHKECGEYAVDPSIGGLAKIPLAR